ncbi:glycoside hydrolase [Pyrenochaeta sp. DS3sAY3a]|nr:glycoside hydrolase [Pyrenochaeta sp. DS3sAY3a]
MKASIIAASVALAGSVAASQHKAHAGFHMRRGGYEADEVCTVYTTVYVTALPSIVHNTTAVYPTSTPCPEDEEKTSIYTPVPVYTPHVPSPEPKPSKEAYVPVPPAPESSKPAYTPEPYPVKPTSSKAADKPKPTGGYSAGGRIVTKGNKWAITYTPYANDGQCKTADEIKSDIKKISDLGFTTIRSYSTDCGVFEYVVPECQKYGLKVIYGIFLEGGGSGGKGPFSPYANAQLEDIKKNAPKENVAMVIVGNECMFNNNCEPSELASYIDYVRKELQGCGFPSDIAVTTTEPVGTWEEKGAALCDHIDIFTVQVHPYFTASISAEEAGDFAKQQLEQAAKVCPGAAAKGKYITEIGWPSAGNANGKAVPGVYEQKVAMKKIIEKVGTEACLFSFQDDGWKHPGAFNVEQNFGCVDALY